MAGKLRGETALVLDTSAAMALFLQETEGAQVEKELEYLIGGNGQVFVPSLFWYETGNTLVTALNRKRITMGDIRGIEADLAALPIVTDPLPDGVVRQRIRELAIEKKLTFYDAAYVELAERLRIPLLSFDKQIMEVLGR